MSVIPSREPKAVAQKKVRDAATFTIFILILRGIGVVSMLIHPNHGTKGFDWLAGIGDCMLLGGYEPEVGTILPRLRSCYSPDDVRRVVHQEFVRWFDASTAGPEERYAKMAAEIWSFWAEVQHHPKNG